MNNVSHNNYQKLVILLPKAGNTITNAWKYDYQWLVISTSYIGALRKEVKKGMDTLFVPMKLTVQNVDDDMSEEQVQNYNELTKTISECANSQNAVKPATSSLTIPSTSRWNSFRAKSWLHL